MRFTSVSQKLNIWIIIVLMMLSSSLMAYAQEKNKIWNICIIRPRSFSSEEQERSLKNNLSALGHIEGRRIRYLSTQLVSSSFEDFADTAKIVQHILKNPPDIFATIGNQASIPTWQILKKTHIPMVFSGVIYPIETGIAYYPNAPSQSNITGVTLSDVPLKRMEIIRKLFPDTEQFKKIAFVYSSQVLQDILYAKKLKAHLRELNWNVIFIDYYDIVQNLPSFKNLVKQLREHRPDLAFGWDSLDQLCDNPKNVLKLTSECKIPIIGSSSQSVDNGSVCSVMTDKSYLGNQQAMMIDQILKGGWVGNIPFSESNHHIIELNLIKAKIFGISFDPGIIQQASRIVE